jgi:DNA modification methylase
MAGTDWLTVHHGDCRDILPTLDAGSVHCVVTSPPYWGLRDYGTASWDGGDPSHEHVGSIQRTAPPGTEKQASNRGALSVMAGDCLCGARRSDRQLGLEPTPEEYVAAMVDVFREVRRVLRDDGTVWLNLGDSYVNNHPNPTQDGSQWEKSGLSGSATTRQRLMSGPGKVVPKVASGLKNKDLVGIPWRVAFALQADGWYLRSDIIWSKPNPMPESVTDRPTKSHEYVFLLSKRERYYFDQEAVREPNVSPEQAAHNARYAKHYDLAVVEAGQNNSASIHSRGNASGRNIRSVWNIATQPYPGAHFAVFPEALVVPCIKAGTSERGVCPECGAPWERVVEVTRPEGYMESYADVDTDYMTNSGRRGGWEARSLSSIYGTATGTTRETTGWRPSCAHDAEPVPAVVLDPFAGSGTVGKVANKLSRRAVLIELNAEYIEQAGTRNQNEVLGLVAG